MKKSRLILAIITNLVDELLIVLAIVVGLPRLGVHIPVWGTVLICLAFLVYAVVFYRIGSTALLRKPVAGLSDMAGIEGRALGRLDPRGKVRVSGEIWKAMSEDSTIEAGEKIVVVRQERLMLVVRPRDSKTAESPASSTGNSPPPE